MSGPNEILWIAAAATLGMSVVAVGVALATLRLLRGPNIVDRIIALDVISALATGLVVLEAIRSGRALFLDIALVMAIILFLSTVAFALYYEKGGRE